MGNKEIRDILLGRIIRLDEEFWAAAPANAKFHFHGVRDGAGDVRLFGVTHMMRSYQTPKIEEAFIDDSVIEPVLKSMGRLMRLESIPKAKSCLYAPQWIAPVLLTVEQYGEQLQVTAYTGRSLLAGKIRCRIALWIFGQRLPAGSVCTGKKMPAKKEAKRVTKTQKPSKSAGKRAATPPKKAAPKRLKK